MAVQILPKQASAAFIKAFGPVFGRFFHRKMVDIIDAANDALAPVGSGAEDNLASYTASGTLQDSGKASPTGDVVGTSDTQTLTNKTIDADDNTISNLAHGAEVDSPSSGVHGVVGSLVGTSDTQTLTNKTLSTPSIASFVNAIHNHENAAGGGLLEIVSEDMAVYLAG